MGVNLTAGAITKMMNGEVASEKDMTPVLQVTELRLMQTKIQKPQQNDRYKLSISDGVLLQHGILTTSLNGLVEEGIIQLGSVIRLTQYKCTLIENRRFVIVMQLEVIADKCDIIRIPGQSSIDQQHGGAGSVNTQINGGFEQQQAFSSAAICTEELLKMSLD